MAKSVEIGSTDIPTLAPEVVGGPTPGLTEAEVVDKPDKIDRITSKQDEVKEEAVEALLDHVNTALVLSVAAVAVVGAIVIIAKKLRER